MPRKKALIETSFGKYLSDRSVNKADISRKTGLSTTRIARLCTDLNAFLRAHELQLIALAIKVDPYQMQKDLFGDLKLKEENKKLSDQEQLNLQILENLKNSIVGDNFDIKDIERYGKILAFCENGKTENEILSYIGLQRKSPNFNAVIKTCVKIDWLDVKQSMIDGKLVKIYRTTEQGNKVIDL